MGFAFPREMVGKRERKKKKKGGGDRRGSGQKSLKFGPGSIEERYPSDQRAF